MTRTRNAKLTRLDLFPSRFDIDMHQEKQPEMQQAFELPGTRKKNASGSYHGDFLTCIDWPSWKIYQINQTKYSM